MSECLAMMALHNPADGDISSSSSSSSSHSREDDGSASSASSSSSDDDEAHSQDILLLDQEWVNNGGSNPRRLSLSVDARIPFGSLQQAATAKLNYTRDIVVCRDEKCERELQNDQAWEICLRDWHAGATARLVNKVEQLAREAAERTEGGPLLEPSAAETLAAAGRKRIRGYEQLYELLEQPANIPGLERAKVVLVAAVIGGLAPRDYADEVTGAAALAAWKMVEKSAVLRQALLSAGVAQRCVALLQHDVLRREDARRGRPNAARLVAARAAWLDALRRIGLKELGGAHYPNKNNRQRRRRRRRRQLFAEDEGSVFCTRTALGVCQNVVGLLDALARADPRARAIAGSGTHWLLSLSADATAMPEPRLMAACALCRTLGESQRSREAFVRRDQNLEDLRVLLKAEATPPFLPLLAVASMSTLLREASIRSLADPEQLGHLFACLVERIQRCLEVIERRDMIYRNEERTTLTSTSAGDDGHDNDQSQTTSGTPTSRRQRRYLQVSTEQTPVEARSLVLHVLEHASLAIWGCAAALRERGEDQLQRLYAAPIARWTTTTITDDGTHEETWPEVLARVGFLALETPLHAPEAALRALANAIAGSGGPTAALRAGKTTWVMFDKLARLVETSEILGVRVFAASALARITTKPSDGLEIFYRGQFDVDGRNPATPADCRLAAVLSSSFNSHALDGAVSAVLLNFAMHACESRPREDAVLRVHVALVNCECSGAAEASMLRGTLRRGCLSIWALARCHQNRRRLNELGAPSALTRALCGGAGLDTKEIAVSALWLLACDDRGAVRVALAEPSSSMTRKPLDDDDDDDDDVIKESSPSSHDATLARFGALPTLVGIVNFDPQSAGYVPIRTLAVGTLCTLAATSDDLLNVVAAYASHFVGALYDLAKGAFPEVAADDDHAKHCLRTLQVLAVALTFRLGECGDGTAALFEAKGARALEQLSAHLAATPGDNEMRALGAFRTAKLACEPARRRALDESQAVQRLAGNVSDNDAPPDLRLYSLHALLNLSTEFALQAKICRLGLCVLLDIARSAEDVPAQVPTIPVDSDDGGRSSSVIQLSALIRAGLSEDERLDLEARYAQSILANLSKNVRCRAMMYQVQLARISTAISDAKRSPAPESHQHDEEQGEEDQEYDDVFAGGVEDVVDDQTLAAFFAKTTRKVKPPQPEDGLTPEQLLRLRPHFFTPVSRLWEDAPPDATREERPQTAGPLSHRASRDGVLRHRPAGGMLHDSASSTALLPPAVARLPRCRTAASARASSRPRSPLRSSYRLGPLAGCGVAALPQGECRWEPRVRSYKRERNAGGSHRSPRIVEVEPLAPYHQLRFHAPLRQQREGSRATRRGSSLDKQTKEALSLWRQPYAPASLAKFKHAPGARLYSDLFPRFILRVDDDDDDKRASYEQCFFYYASSIVCEAVDPGPADLPKPPLSLDAIAQQMPPLPSLPSPEASSKPKVYRPGSQVAPLMRRHALELSARTGVLGGIPSDPLPLHTRMVEEPPVEEPDADTPPPWTLKESLFASRVEECDARNFYETPKVWKRALDVDWKRVLQEERFSRFVSRHDEGVQQGQSLDEEIAEIKAAFAKRYSDILRVFDFYCASSSITTKAAFSISENCYNRFLQECRIPHDSTACTVEECSRIFVACNYEADKKSQEAEINEDKALMRHEFIECLVRIAVARFCHETKDVSDCLDRLFDEVIFKNIPGESMLDPDAFRRERLYTEETERSYLPHAKVLKIIYHKYSLLNPVQGKPKFGLNEWTAMLADSHLLGEIITMREIRLSFWWSRMAVIDEIKSRFKFMTHSWVEFLEAIGRIADMTSLPTDQDLALVNAVNLLDFKSKLEMAPLATQERCKQRRPSSVWNNLKTRSLADKVDKFCRLLIGRLAIKFKGNIAANNKRAPGVVGTYVTKQQLQEMTLN